MTAHDFGVPESQLAYIVEHEAPRTSTGDFVPCGLGDTNLAKPSVGLAQISMIYHPEISPEVASNPDFAIEYIASALRENKCSEWTACRAYEKLLKDGPA